MAIRRRGRSWLVTVEMGRDPLTGRRRRVNLTASTRREAEREEARLRHEVATGIDIEPSKITLAEYLGRWLESMRPNLGPRTFARYVGLMRHQVIPRIGGVSLTKLRPLHVQQLYAKLRENGRVDGRGLADKSLLQTHRILSEALKHAVALQFVHQNVCQMVKAPQVRRKEVRTLSPDETRVLVDAATADDSVYGDAIVLAIHTGMRLGELLGLKWDDVDLDQERLTVKRSLQHLGKNRVVFQQPKTPKGRRSMPLGPTALDALKRLRRRQLEERLSVGPGYKEQGLVLASAVGTPISPANVRRAFERILKSAGVERVRFHDLRHTHASLLLARGIHPKVVSERLGHASIAITLDTYSHDPSGS
jgi:integrase